MQDAAGSQNLYALKEYQDLADEATECTYDANGNLTRDLDRGITHIRYNRLNLPEWVTFTNGDRISMDYDATGRLLEMSCINLSTKLMPLIVDGERVQANIPVTEGYGTLYGDGIDYEYEYVYDETTGHSRPTITNVRVHHPEGYADVSERYYAEDHFYYYRYDYLGNVCEVWSPGWEMAPGSFAPPHVAQQTRYYPSGLPKVPLLVEGLQPYKYGGKEYVEGHGWDMYDSGARWYYPAIMRTTSPDPLAEKYYDTSPYAWCGNNPVNAVDPTGMEWFYYSTDGESDPTWNWRDETEYRTGVYDTNGNEVVLQGHEAVVVFEGSLDERLGEDGTLTGENSKAANVTIYGINGADDIKTYKGLTVTSNPDKYSMVKSGEYNLSWEQMQTSPYGKGSLTYRIRQLNGNEQLPIEGGGLNKATGKSYLSAVFLHRTNWSGSAIYSSQGCLIIDGRQWKSVEQQLQKTTGNMLLQIYR